MAAISGYFWFATARSICSWVCVNFDLIYYGSNLVAFDLFWVLCVNFVAGFVAGFDL